MKTVIYSMGVSADGYVAGPDGDFNWTAPDPELFAFHHERIGQLSAYILGRRLYETMLVWENDPAMRETPEFDAFADMWSALPKVVFSRTLTSVQGNARLARGTIEEELAQLPDGIVSVGGPDLAGQFIRQDLVDEFWMFQHRIVVGGGTSYFPPLASSLRLELLESREFEHVDFRRLGRVRD